MSDSFTTTTTQSYGSRLKGAFFGIFFGVILFFGSFFLLFLNEGRIDLSEIAEKSIEVISQSPENDGKFISTSGEIVTEEIIGDDVFIKEGDYIYLQRIAYMFSWVEHKKTASKENLGGSKTTTTTYTYKKEWRESPEDSADFQVSNGHVNPKKSIDSDEIHVESASVNGYNISMGRIGNDGWTPLKLTKNILTKEGLDYTEDAIFVGEGSIGTPRIGDLKIVYRAMPHNTFVTVFGKAEGINLIPYTEDDGKIQIFQLFSLSREEALENLHGQYVFVLWAMRVLGFAMMWGGLMLIFGLLTTILAVIPMLAQMGRRLIGLFTFTIALILSLLTILIGIIFHNIFLLIGVILVALIGIFIGIKKVQSSQSRVEIPETQIDNKIDTNRGVRAGGKHTQNKTDESADSDGMIELDLK